MPPSDEAGGRLGPADVLVLRALGLGDALTGVAALRGLRRAWPGRRLVLAAPAAVGGWLRDLGIIEAVVPASGLDEPLAVSGDGHLAVNLHGRGPRSHQLLQATGPAGMLAFACPEAGVTRLPAAPAGLASAPAGAPADPAAADGAAASLAPRWRAEEHEVGRWCRLVSAAGGPCGPADLRLPPVAPAGHGHVVLHPGAASVARRWPVERWAALAGRLAAAGTEVLITGSGDERELCDAVAAGAARPRADATDTARGEAAPGTGAAVRSVAGGLGLAQLASLLAGARLLICGDTGVAHLATGLGMPSVLLFGPVSPAMWGPPIDPERHVVLWHGDGSGDPHGSQLDPALAAITVAEVWHACQPLLGRAPRAPTHAR